jgi:TPR repeat protein
MYTFLVKHDFNQARQLFEKAAAAGSNEAKHNLGALYEGGLGGPLDLQQARQWYEKAAAGGDKEAQERLKMLSP